jgi:hypothetical protein
MNAWIARHSAIVGIVVANALTLLVALWLHWPLVLLLWPFWIQSVLIGWYARKRILARSDATAANFFAIHYGIFHGAYAGLLMEQSGSIRALDWALIAGVGIAFWIGLRRAHAANMAADARAERGLGALMAIPYARILPMHACAGLAFVAADAAVAPLIVVGFVALKTAADVLMHVLERRWLQAALPAA